MQSVIEQKSMEFFENLGTDYSELSVQEEAENIYRISLKSNDSHILIGPHGKNLEMLTHILKLVLGNISNVHINIHLEINDYLAQKEKKLINFIRSKIRIVEDTGTEVILPYLTAYERKKVHSCIGELSTRVVSESKGIGRERRIHLSRKSEKLSIDVDGDSI